MRQSYRHVDNNDISGSHLALRILPSHNAVIAIRDVHSKAFMADPILTSRDIVFISKATPGDDDFALWLAPRLEAEGYRVYADILRLEPGTRWRNELTTTLQTRAVKMLLCCSDSTLARNGVQEEIGIAEDLVRELNDPKFIIPLRLKPFKKVFGIGGLQYIDFEQSWAGGLQTLLDALEKQHVPRDTSFIDINPNWELCRRRNEILIRDEPEPLTSNWLRMLEMPDAIRFYEPTGAIDLPAMMRACAKAKYPTQSYLRGFFSFASLEDVNTEFSSIGKFTLTREFNPLSFIKEGWPEKSLDQREASNLVHSMCRKAWEAFCINLGLLRYEYSADPAFHISRNQVKIGQRVQWGAQGQNRSSMLRNRAKGYVWQYGVTAIPAFWPYPHFKLKSRVLFAETAADEEGALINDKKKQHRLRRSVCKGWRNKQWHGRLRAFLELLCGEASSIVLQMGSEARIRVEAMPVYFTSPVTTELPNEVDDGEDEDDLTTMTGTPYNEEED